MKRAIISFLFIFFPIFSSPASILAAGEEPSVYEYIKQKSNGELNERNFEEPNQLGESASAGVTAFDFVKMIFALAFVLALIYFLLKFVKNKNRYISGTKYLENLGGTSLGQNRSIQIVKAGNRILILGVSDSIQLLKEIDDPAEMEIIMNENVENTHKNIQENIRNVWNLKRKMSKKETSFKDELHSLLQERSEQLKLLNKKGNKS